MERESGADYFVRELPDGTIAWVGEHAPRPGEFKAFTNVFLGRRTGPDQAVGELFDVPKGMAVGVYGGVQVNLRPGEEGFRFPDGGVRALVHPETDLPVTDSLEWGAGFYDEAPGSTGFTLTGVWRCNDGGTYYVRQFGDRVVWLGEHPTSSWCNIFFGNLARGRVTGRWIDVPKGGARGSGQITLAVDNSILPVPDAAQTRMTRVSASGGFGGSEWRKTDSVRVNFRLFTLNIIRNADVGGLNAGGDEPYLMPVYITAGGNQYTDAAQLLRVDSGAGPSFTSPLFQHEWGTRGDWPKNNLTWQEDLVPGTAVSVPDYISYFETELRSIDGLQPNSRLGRDTANFVPGVLAMEEASSRNDDIRAGYRELLSRGPSESHSRIVEGLRTGRSVQEIVNAIRAALTTRYLVAFFRSVMSDLFAYFTLPDADKQMGGDFTAYSLGTLRDAALRRTGIPVTMTFQGGGGGLWVATGMVAATLGPARFATSIEQLEVTFETGDEKRGRSQVALALRMADGTMRGPLRAHAPGRQFADGSLHTVSIPLAPAVLLGDPRELRIVWNRDPGDHLLLGPDRWELRRIRVVAFDRFNRRRVLLGTQPVFRLFAENATVAIPLPVG